MCYFLKDQLQSETRLMNFLNLIYSWDNDNGKANDDLIMHKNSFVLVFLLLSC